MAKKKIKKKETTRKKPSQEKEAGKLIIAMLGILIIIVLIVIIVKSMDSFEYKDINFQKIKYGEIILYSAKVPLTNAIGQVVSYIKVDFRTDPRTLRDVVIEDPIFFKSNKQVYLTVSPETEECEDSGIAIVNLGGVFLKETGLKTQLGSIDKKHAEQQIIPHFTCEDAVNGTVIIVKRGEENIIKEVEDYCYEINFKDCEIIKAVEAFELKVIEQHIDSIPN